MGKHNTSYTLFLISFLLLSCTAFAQEIRLAGSLFHQTGFHPIPSAHIINASTQKGTITTKEGYFSIMVNKADTLNISALGFSEYQLIITDSLLDKTKNIRVYLQPTVYELDVIHLTPYGPGVFQRDFEKAPIRDIDASYPGKPTKRRVPAVAPPMDISNIFDLIYEELNGRSEQIRKVKELREKDKYEEWIDAIITSKVQKEYLQLQPEHISVFMYYYKDQAFHPLDKEYQVLLSAKETLPYFYTFLRKK